MEERPPSTTGLRPRQCVLVGTGALHVQLLAHLAAHPLAGMQVSLVATQPQPMYPELVSGLVSGLYTDDKLRVDLVPLAKRAGIQWIKRNIVSMDAQQQNLVLNDGSVLHYDWLSIDSNPMLERARIEQAMPGAREHGLFVYPLEAFASLWPQVEALGTQRALRIAVIGAGNMALELAMAVRQRLPTAAITLLSGPENVGNHLPAKLQALLVASLKRRSITVVPDLAIGFSPGAVQLACGAALSCDVPLVALPSQCTPWALESGLATNAQGRMDVDAFQRSTSHPQVFATNGPCPATGAQWAHNLSAAMAQQDLQVHATPNSTLQILSCGDGSALGSWKQHAGQGTWVQWVKNIRDRRALAKYRSIQPGETLA